MKIRKITIEQNLIFRSKGFRCEVNDKNFCSNDLLLFQVMTEHMFSCAFNCTTYNDNVKALFHLSHMLTRSLAASDFIQSECFTACFN